jgi:2-iminoacetate synthase
MGFLNLLPSKALNHIEEMAQKAREMSAKHFDKGILLYTPSYVSNFCIDNCVSYNFSTKNKTKFLFF